MSARSFGDVTLAVSLVFVAACGGETKPNESPLSPPAPKAVALADGTHFGFVTDIDVDNLQLGFDEAELFGGLDATNAARDDRGGVTRGGHYVDNPDVRSVRVQMAADVEIRLLSPCCELHPVGLDDWLGGFAGDDRTFFGTSMSHYELSVVDGDVVAVDEVQVT